jgi:TM2 domain-containing membrane protein YozV
VASMAHLLFHRAFTQAILSHFSCEREQMADKQDGPSRVTIGIVAIVIGSLGVHKFMLGQTTPGIIQIAATVFTCGAAGIIGPIEGIIYLMKTDEDFHKTYVVEKKAWF